ncbi:MAG TPA: 2-octaprenyl-6-methoxyphenyl hydroxylase, partial [Parvularcula sp.]|nr:2-octaprenyl-6-methoxyphenyl hydroxylase [Parvularcula sp.]
MAQIADTIIVGGGLAGGLCALALGGEGLDVALIDAEDPARFRDETFDGRTTALAYAGARVFRRLGLWPAIESEAEPILDILVTDGRPAGPGRRSARSACHLHFDSRALKAEEPLGYIIENRVLRAAIYDAIERSPRIALIAPARAGDPDFSGGAARLSLDGGRRLEAPLI